MAEWLHLFPSRTEQLSTHTPKIVFAKIGRCLIFFCPFFWGRKAVDGKRLSKLDKQRLLNFLNVLFSNFSMI